MKIVSINIASPVNVSLSGGPRKTKSGIFKTPVQTPVFLDYLGFKGDGVGDTKIHGGRDKAVCAYCLDHYPFWNEKLQRQLAPGSFGENLSLSGMLETEVNIGDIYEVGSVQIEVTQPRQPCHKLNKIFNDQSMACNVQKTGFSGYYLRVLKTGFMEPGSTLNRIYSGSFTVENANALLRKGAANISNMETLVSLEALSDDWRGMIHKRLNKLKASL